MLAVSLTGVTFFPRASVGWAKQIRTALPFDTQGIHRVSGHSARAAYEEVVGDETIIEAVERSEFEDQVRAWLDEVADDDRVIYLVAAGADQEGNGAGSDIVGFTQLSRGDRSPEPVVSGEAFLVSLCVDSERWNEGAGSALLDAAIDRLPDDVAVVSLEVLARNDLARGFYEDRCFRPVADETYEVDDVAYPSERYARTLD